MLYFAYEESAQQIARNMRSVGVDLTAHITSGALRCIAMRPTTYGLEMHLATIHKAVRQHKPKLVIVDPITNFFSIATENEVKSMLMRLVDFLKGEQITAVFTSLTGGGKALEATDAGVSSIIDTWLLLRDIELNGERNRAMYVIKSRGTAHSNQIREFMLSRNGIQLVQPYLGPEGVLTGSARAAQEAKEAAGAADARQEAARKRRQIERRRRAVEAQIAALRAELEADVEELEHTVAEESGREERTEAERRMMAIRRITSSETARVLAGPHRAVKRTKATS